MRARNATWVAVTTAVLSGWITVLAPAAFAQPVPPDGPPFGPPPQAPPPAPVRVVEVGPPLWLFLLVALTAAALTIVVQQLIAHRHHVVRSAASAA
jgi:hypothetical protein